MGIARRSGPHADRLGPAAREGAASTPKVQKCDPHLAFYLLRPLAGPNRDLFDNENAGSVTKIACSLLSVQVTRGASSGNNRGT